MTAAPAPPRVSTQEKIARLRQNFVAQLPARIERIQDLGQQLGHGTNAQACSELHRLVHNLKGTGGSFGFSDLASSAGALEDLLQTVSHGVPIGLQQSWQSALAQHLQELSALVGHVVHTTRTDAPADTSLAYGAGTPGFTLGTSEPADMAHPMLYVCDDDPCVLEQLSTQLACFGYQCQRFTDPLALRQAVLAQRPDVVIMDIHFPQGHSAGIEILQALQAESGEPLPAVFLSSREDFEARLGAVRAGGQAYFVKPVRANELVNTLDALTRRETPEPYRVLIVDDEPQTAHYHALLLQEAGILTHELHEPTQVLQALAQFRPDLVLMDMYMPRSNGREAAAIIRQVPSHIGLPIVYLTSETDRRKLLSAMRIGVEGFLSKPVIPEELVAAVLIRAERMRALRSLMARDSLTGLFNHTMTTQLLENALVQAQREGSPLCLVMLDMDHFKSINDTWGHLAGDQVLLALARVLQQRLRASDIVGRYGGEEFAVILRGQALPAAHALIDTLRQDFAQVVFHSNGRDFHCTFSAGIAAYPQHQRYEQLREAADRALYCAKKQGRNRVCADAPSTPDAP